MRRQNVKTGTEQSSMHVFCVRAVVLLSLDMRLRIDVLAIEILDRTL